MNSLHLTGKLSESNVFKINGSDGSKFLYDTKVVMVNTSPSVDQVTVCLKCRPKSKPELRTDVPIPFYFKVVTKYPFYSKKVWK
jgi:hypothetical protein